MRTDLIQALSRQHKVQDGGRTGRVSTSKLGVEQLARRFARGEPRAIRELILLAEASGLRLGLLPAEAVIRDAKPEHAAIVRRFAERIRQAPQEPLDRVLAPPGFLEDFLDED